MNNVLNYLRGLTFIAVCLGALVACSDHAGLGESVDTEAPKLTITYPPSNAFIKDTFIVAGTWSDDKSVSSIAVTVKDASSNTVYTGNADVASDGTWQIELNDYDPENSAYYNGYEFADGTYKVSAVASDGSGHTSDSISDSFTVDNTAPVLVLTKPTTVGTNSAKSYGQQVQLLGSFSELSDSKISNLTITFYKTDGTVKHETTFSNIIDMSSANPLTIAQYYDDDENLDEDETKKWENYKALYSSWDSFDENTGSEQSYFTVTAYDSAKIYQTVGDSGTGSGNVTSSYYRGTTDMQKLTAGSYDDDFKDFNVLSLRNYLNGTDTTYSADSDLAAKLETILSAAKSISFTESDGNLSAADLSRTSTDDGNVFLTFQVNPNNNPKFTASGYAIDESKADGSTYSTTDDGAAGYKLYSVGGPIILGVAPGLDETNIDTSTVSVYAVDASVDSDSLAEGWASNKILVWTWNEEVAVSYAAGKVLTSADSEYETYQALVTKDPDSYRYTVTASDENTDSLSQEASLAETDVTAGKPYYLYVEGADINGQDIVNYTANGYGIWPSTTASKPEITFGTADAETRTNLAEDAVINQDSFEKGLTFSGTVDSDIVELSTNNPLTYTVTLTSASDSTQTASVDGIPTYELASEDGELPYIYGWNFTVEPSEAMAEMLATEGRFTFSLAISAKNAAGTTKETRKIIIDTKAPTVSNLSITNSVTTNSVVYINPANVTDGTYTISGSSGDNYSLEKTTYTITGIKADGSTLVISSDDTGATQLVTADGKAAESWSLPVDLSLFAPQSGAADIVAAFTAYDAAGNDSGAVTLELEIDATAPTVTLTAGSSTSTWNKSTALSISGTTADAESGATTVYYKLNDASSYTALAVASNAFSTNETFAVGTNTISYYVVDAVGNTSVVATKTVQIDTVTPTVSELPTSSDVYTSFTAQKFKNTTAGMTFAFLAYDADSKVDTDSISITIGDETISKTITSFGTITATEQPVTLTKNDSGTITGITAATTDTEGSVTGYKIVVLLNESLGANLTESNLYTVTATVPDYAGNAYTPQIGILTLDKTDPVVNVTKATDTDTYVRNTKAVTVSISDTATLTSAVYALFAVTDTEFASPLTNAVALTLSEDGTSVSSATVTFTVDTTAVTALTDASTFVVAVRAIDTAGNTSKYANGTSAPYTIDRTAPALSGDTLGGKTPATESVPAEKTWLSDATLTATGTLTDSGSGASAIYYQLIAAGDTATATMTADSDENTGYATLGTKIAVTSTNGTATFEKNIDGFVAGSAANTVNYVVVDAVGNVSDVYTRYIWRDNVKPVFADTSNETKTGKTGSTFTFTCTVTDAASGVSDGKFVVAIGDNTISASETTYGTIAYDSETGAVTVTTTAALTASGEDAKLTDGKLYTVNLTAYDVAGNSDTKTISYVKVDNKAPVITVTEATGTAAYASGEKTITASVTETGNIASVSWDVFAYSADKTDYTSATSLLSGTKTDAGSTASITVNFAATKDDGSYKFADGAQYIVLVKATDEAGNTSTYKVGSESDGNADHDPRSSAYTIDRSAPTLSSATVNTENYTATTEAAASWYNASTLAIGGTWSDEASGASMMYYQVDDGTATAMTKENYASVKTGSLALTGSSSAGYSFDTNITDLATTSDGDKTYGTYTLRYVAVDAVKNVSDVYTRVVKVDRVAPTFTERAETESIVSKTSNLTLTGFGYTDVGSGIKSVTVAVGNTSENILDDTRASKKITYNEGTLTFDSSLFTATSATYTVTATAVDNAGNSTQTTLGTIIVDNTAPKVSITNASSSYVNSSVSLTVSASDANGIYTNSTGTGVDTASKNQIVYTVYNATVTTSGSTTTTTVGAAIGSAVTATLDNDEVEFTLETSSDTYTDGLTFLVRVTAYDQAGNYTESDSKVYTIDKTAPVFYAGTDTTGDYSGYTANSFADTTKWYKDSSLSASGTFTEKGSGIAAVYYMIVNENGTAPTTAQAVVEGGASFSTNDKGSYETFSTSLSGFAEGLNTVYYVAVDNVGNVGTLSASAYVYEDTTPPQIAEIPSSDGTEVTIDGSTVKVGDVRTAFDGTTITNGQTAQVLYFYVTDTSGGSGIDLTASDITVKIGTTAITPGTADGKSSYAIASVTTETVNETTVTTKALVKVTLGTNDLSSLSGYKPVTVTVKDNAGNSSDATTVSTLNIDTTAPSVSFSSYASKLSGTSSYTEDSSLSASSVLNKTVRIRGKTTDANDIAAVTLTASATNESGESVSHEYGLSVSDATYALTYSDGEWYCDIDTTAYYNSTGTATLTLSLTATDKADNTSPAVSITPTINQQKNRPVVKVTNLTKDDDGTYILKSVSNAQLSGTITDDDSTSDAVVTTFVVSGVECTVDGTTITGATGTTTFDADGGEWTYTPADTGDGTKTVYFYLVDNAGNVFYTGAGVTETDETGTPLSQPYFQYKTTTATDNSAAISYLSDNTNPKIAAASAVAYTSSGTASAEEVGVTTSLIMGGTQKAKAQFIVTASDENGIASLSFTVTDSSSTTIASRSVSYTENGTELVYDSTNADASTKTYVWTTPADSLFDLSSAYVNSSGSLALKVTAVDNCGLESNNTFTFMLDNTAPAITVSSPSSTEELTSSATIIGSATDSGGSSTVAVGYLVPKTGTTYNDTYYKAQAGYLLDYYNWTQSGSSGSYSGTVSDFAGTNTGTASNWQYAFKNSTDQTLETYEAYTGSSGSYSYTYDVSIASGSIANENEIWKIPLYFIAVDALGNYTVHTSYSVLHNPHADIPSTVISYPNDGDYDSSTDASGNTTYAAYATIGGSIRVTGTVSIEDTNASLGAVYLQVGKVTYADDGETVSSVDWSYGGTSSAYTSDTVTKDGLTVHDDDAVKTALGLGDSQSLTFITSESGSYSTSDDFWGLAATVKSSSWNLTLNNGEGLNLDNDTNYIAIRACAFNSNGKMGAWAGPYYIHVDNDVPEMSLSLQQISATLSDHSSATAVVDLPTASAEKTYTADMYLRDPNADWYLVVDYTDASGIDLSTVKVSGTSSGKYVYPYAETSSGSKKFNCKVYIPIVITSTSVSYTVEAYDNDQTAKKSQATYSLYIDNDAPAISALTDSSGNNLAMTKIRNSNYVVTVKSTADESGSGFYGTALYFKRTVDGTTTIELPVPSYSTSGTTTTASQGTALVKTVQTAAVELGNSDSVSDKVSLSGETADVSGLYGIWLTGATRSSTTTFEHALVSDYYSAGLIRVGGFVRIAGSYYQIDSISGDVVTLDTAVSTSYTSAFFAMAFVVDNTNAESSSWSSGTQTISKDDGDGIVESVEKSGSTYTWDVSFYSDELEDGPITICTAVFDKAGNVTSSYSTNSAKDTNADTTVMITNRTPRLTKVFLATDLNGDGSFSASEFVYGSVYAYSASGRGTTSADTVAKNYLASLESGSESDTAIVMVGAQGDWKDTSGNETLSESYFRITDSTVVSMEFVGSTSTDSNYYEGYGVGNGNIYPYLSVGSSAVTSPDTTADHQLKDSDSNAEAIASLSEDSAIKYTDIGGRGLKLPLTTFYKDSAAVTTYGEYTESTSSKKTVQYLSLTLWDETKGTSVGTASVEDTTTYNDNLTHYESFGSQYTVLNIPVYFDFVDDSAPMATITPFYWTADKDGSNSLYYSDSSKRGHIDLEAYRSDGIPAVSGVIKIEGSAYDDQRIGSIAVYADGTAIASISYDSTSDSFGTAGDSKLSNTSSAGYYYLSATSSFSQDSGHTASWTLLIDTANALGNAESMPITVVATQAKSAGTSGYLTSTAGTTQTTSATKTDYYNMTVVPYITEIARSSTTIAGGNMNRSKLGHYAVSEGETLIVNGYNFGTSAAVTVGTTSATVSTASTQSSVSGAGSLQITVPAVSGKLTVTATTSSLNNSNADPTISGNEASSSTASLNYNLESYQMKGNNSTTYYADDDRYLEVWNMGSGFANTSSSTEFQQPVMTADKSGNLYASWGAASNGQIMFSYGVKGSATPIFNCYDQPAQYTAVAYDKYGTSGGASVMYMGEQQGAGGTYSSTGLSSSMIIGGAFVTNVPETYITNQTVSTSKTNVVTGNPSMAMDGDNTTGFYNLANYDISRRLGSFVNPQAARYGNYLHNVWYDSNTESLRYSMVDVGATNITTTDWSNRGGALANWVVLDGGYTGQDRLHTWSTASLTYETVETKNKTIDNVKYYALSVDGTVGEYKYTSEAAALATYINTNISNNYLTSGGKYHTVMAKGATGNYQGNATYYPNDIFLGAGQQKVASRSLCISNVTETSLTTTGISYNTKPAAGQTIALMVNDLGSYSITLRQISSVTGSDGALTISWSEAVSNYASIDSATIYQGDLNVVDANGLGTDGTYTGSSGSSAALDLTSNGYPVVAYFDDNSSTLRIAKATSTTPTSASDWVRTTTSLSCAGSVSLAVDGADNIHVVYKDEDGQMCYAFGALDTSTNKYTLKSEVIDATTSSDYTAISVIEATSGSTTTYTPAVTYLANSGTAQSMKYAYRTSAPSSSGSFSADNWDYMLLPLLGTGRYALASNPVSLESRKSGWTEADDTDVFNNGSSYNTATPATVQSVVAFKSKTKFETAYLKKE